MYQTILVPTDGSPFSEKAVLAAMTLAKEVGARVVGLTVVAPERYAGVADYQADAYNAFHNRALKEAEERLSSVVAAAQAAGVACETLSIESPHVWSGIVDTAREKGCDLIVMASHGRSGVQAFLLGSEAQKVLTHSEIPVLIYR